VGGSVLAGEIGWLSSEYGLASDPHNMLDAQVVKTNGEIIWACDKFRKYERYGTDSMQ
jgi:hypothetical protein